MAIADLFRTRKSNRVHRQVWKVLWERVKTPPAGDAGARELHAVFVGTLLYASRYQAALAAGMEQSTAKTIALQAVAGANFDGQMRDQVLSVFAANPEPRADDYAVTLQRVVADLVERTGARGGAPGGGSAEDVLAEVDTLMPVLAGQLPAAG